MVSQSSEMGFHNNNSNNNKSSNNSNNSNAADFLRLVVGRRSSHLTLVCSRYIEVKVGHYLLLMFSPPKIS